MAYEFDILISDDASAESMFSQLYERAENIIQTIDLMQLNAGCLDGDASPSLNEWRRVIGCINTMRQALCYMTVEIDKAVNIIDNRENKTDCS